jgi:hypothetical protein
VADFSEDTQTSYLLGTDVNCGSLMSFKTNFKHKPEFCNTYLRGGFGYFVDCYFGQILVVDCRLKRQNVHCRLVLFKDDIVDLFNNPCRWC